MGQAKCVNWLTGSAKNTDHEVAMERRRRTLRALGVAPPADGCVEALRRLVAPNLPTGAKKGRGGGAAVQGCSHGSLVARDVRRRGNAAEIRLLIGQDTAVRKTIQRDGALVGGS